MNANDSHLIHLVRKAIAGADFLVFDGLENPESLYFSAEKPRGLRRILIGTLPFVKDAVLHAELRTAFAMAPPEQILERPYENECPLGFIIARNPCENLPSLPTLLRTAQSTGASPLIAWNTIHLEMLRETLDLVFATCLVNGLKGDGKIDSSSVRKRILDQHRHLVASDYSSNNATHMTPAEKLACTSDSISPEFTRRRLLALRSLADAETQREKKPMLDIFTRISGNWSSASVALRGENETTIESELRGYPNRLRKFLFFSEPDNLRTPMTPVGITENALRNSDKIPSLSRVAGPGIPCFPELRSLLRTACSSLEQPGAVAVAFLISSAVKPWEILPQNIQLRSACAVIQRPVKLWQDSLVVDTTIHRLPTKTFVSFTTKGIGAAIQRQLEAGNTDLQCEASAWLEANSLGITIPSLCSALLHNFPLWTKIPAIYYELGINALRQNRPGWMHYIHYDPSNCLPVITKLCRTEIDPNFFCDAQGLDPTGSALCPTTECLSTLFETVGDLIQPPSLQNAEELIAASNVIAAAARLAENLLTFTRNRDAFEPLRLNARVRISTRDIIRDVREKEYSRTIVYTQSLRSVLFTLNRSLHQYLARFRETGLRGADYVDQRIYWFLALKENQLVELPPIHRTVSDSLAANPRTEAFQYLHRRAMRNYSNTILRDDDVLAEDAIQAIHDHFPSRARSPRSPDSQRMPVMYEECEAAAVHLLTKLNFAWATL